MLLLEIIYLIVLPLFLTTGVEKTPRQILRIYHPSRGELEQYFAQSLVFKIV
jgi:hypothetical protein